MEGVIEGAQDFRKKIANHTINVYLLKIFSGNRIRTAEKSIKQFEWLLNIFSKIIIMSQMKIIKTKEKIFWIFSVCRPQRSGCLLLAPLRRTRNMFKEKMRMENIQIKFFQGVPEGSHAFDEKKFHSHHKYMSLQNRFGESDAKRRVKKV